MRNGSLTAAKNAKNDEFYTQLVDIEKELAYYHDHFVGKIVFCNCDDPIYSNFWRYFHENFSKLGLKKLIATHYSQVDTTYALEYLGGDDENIESGVKTALSQNGDFRSVECLELLEISDIVVTNPPFSLFREYVSILMQYQKKFIIVGSKNAITYKEFFRFLQSNQIWLGYHNVMTFMLPDGSFKKFGNIGWYTNLDITKRHVPLILTKKYESGLYQVYDNYGAINVNKISDIPFDYDGVMGVPITFLDKHDPEQFEILGYTNGRQEFDVLSHPTKRYINAKQHNKDGSIVNGSKANTKATIAIIEPSPVYYTADNCASKLKMVYVRILIRRKK